jgi:hypothetical protein
VYASSPGGRCSPTTSPSNTVYINPRGQHGQRGKERVTWIAIWRRRVAMERGLCLNQLDCAQAIVDRLPLMQKRISVSGDVPVLG